MVTGSTGLAEYKRQIGIAVTLGVVLAAFAGVLAVTTLPDSAKTTISSTTSGNTSTSTTVRSAFAFNAQVLNSSIVIPTSGKALIDFQVNSTVTGTFYFEAIPNDTIPVMTQIFFSGETNAPFPIPNETLPAGLSASYPNGQILLGKSQGMLALDIAVNATPPGDYTLYLCVYQESGSAGEASALPFTLEVTGG